MLHFPLNKENTMYVYVWKDQDGAPFYVGMSKNLRRPSPKSLGSRNKNCAQKVQEVGVDSVIIELHTAPNVEAARLLEQALIAKYGKLSDGSGTLTNISKGGEFHASLPATNAKLQLLWKNPDHRAKVAASRLGTTRNLPESTKDTLRQNLQANPAMKGWGERNGLVDEFNAKRIAGIQAAQPRRAEKMRDPVALAQRKARLSETLMSPEYKAKRALWDTPEFRQRQSDNKKAYWAAKKANIGNPG
jgi:hypothetical protein